MKLIHRAIGCLLAAAASLATAQDGVRLQFAWPDRLVARVESQKTKSKQIDGQAPTEDRGTSTFVIQSQRRDGQYRVSFSDLQLDAERLALMSPQQRELVGILAKSALPGYVVSRSGEFLAVDNLKDFQSTMRAALVKAVPPGMPPERLTAVLDNVLSEAMIKAVVQGEWNWMVEAWTGGTTDLLIGEPYEVTTKTAMPVVNAPLTNHIRFRIARKLPCERDGQTRECIELLATSTPDETEMREAVAAFMKRLAPAGDNVDLSSLASMNFEVTLELITETATLVPHYFKLRKVTTMTSGESGKPQARRQVEETEQTFRHGAPALALPQGNAANP